MDIGLPRPVRADVRERLGFRRAVAHAQDKHMVGVLLSQSAQKIALRLVQKKVNRGLNGCLVGVGHFVGPLQHRNEVHGGLHLCVTEVVLRMCRQRTRQRLRPVERCEAGFARPRCTGCRGIRSAAALRGVGRWARWWAIGCSFHWGPIEDGATTSMPKPVVSH
ncbi:hypothetical protein [Hydrogenophaga sp.]|uniref:hypothetical protein n=1 Tax=Hydrogenophaga sp. TaxID=1904254 RepID=UPI002729F0DE|nr:hypothetical protein [Hydrogenophaga sp.]